MNSTATSGEIIEPDPLAVATAALDRARAEVKLLAAVAPCGRWGMRLAEQAGITLPHFTADDTHAIYAALVVADRIGRIIDREATARLVVQSLRSAGLFDPDDTRPFASGMKWGLPAVAALFSRLSRHEAEAVLPMLAGNLLALPHRWEAA